MRPGVAAAAVNPQHATAAPTLWPQALQCHPRRPCGARSTSRCWWPALGRAPCCCMVGPRASSWAPAGALPQGPCHGRTLCPDCCSKESWYEQLSLPMLLHPLASWPQACAVPLSFRATPPTPTGFPCPRRARVEAGPALQRHLRPGQWIEGLLKAIELLVEPSPARTRPRPGVQRRETHIHCSAAAARATRLSAAPAGVALHARWPRLAHHIPLLGLLSAPPSHPPTAGAVVGDRRGHPAGAGAQGALACQRPGHEPRAPRDAANHLDAPAGWAAIGCAALGAGL